MANWESRKTPIGECVCDEGCVASAKPGHVTQCLDDIRS